MKGANIVFKKQRSTLLIVEQTLLMDLLNRRKDYLTQKSNHPTTSLSKGTINHLFNLKKDYKTIQVPGTSSYAKLAEDDHENEFLPDNKKINKNGAPQEPNSTPHPQLSTSVYRAPSSSCSEL